MVAVIHFLWCKTVPENLVAKVQGFKYLGNINSVPDIDLEVNLVDDPVRFRANLIV